MVAVRYSRAPKPVAPAKEEPPPSHLEAVASTCLFARRIARVYTQLPLPVLLFAVLSLAFSVLANLALPVAVGALFDASVDGAIGLPAVLAVSAALAQCVSIVLRTGSIGIVAHRALFALRTELFEHVLALDIAFHDEHPASSLVAALSTDIAQLQGVLDTDLNAVVYSASIIAAAFPALLWYNWQLALVSIALTPAMGVAAFALIPKLERLSTDMQDDLTAATLVAQDALSGVRTVRTFNRAPAFAERYAAPLSAMVARAVRRNWLYGYLLATSIGGSSATVALVLWRGGVLIAAGKLTGGQFTTFILLTHLVRGAGGELVGSAAAIGRAAGATRRAFELLEHHAPAVETRGVATPSTCRGEVVFDRVTFAYPLRPTPVLVGVSLRLKAGARVGFVGSSGSGKSTLLALLQRFYDVNGGVVTLDGVPVAELEPSWLRRQLGVVSQEPTLFVASVRDNIAFGASTDPSLVDQAVVERAARGADAHEFISGLTDGYETAVGERGANLSGGQRQRIAIARALVREPRLLIFDEATSALDSESEALVARAIGRIEARREHARTTVHVAHRLSTIRGADMIYVFVDGQVAEQGTHGELLARGGQYAALAQLQAGADPQSSN